jgi:hypothetical protein
MQKVNLERQGMHSVLTALLHSFTRTISGYEGPGCKHACIHQAVASSAISVVGRSENRRPVHTHGSAPRLTQWLCLATSRPSMACGHRCVACMFCCQHKVLITQGLLEESTAADHIGLTLDAQVTAVQSTRPVHQSCLSSHRCHRPAHSRTD